MVLNLKMFNALPTHTTGNYMGESATLFMKQTPRIGLGPYQQIFFIMDCRVLLF